LEAFINLLIVLICVVSVATNCKFWRQIEILEEKVNIFQSSNDLLSQNIIENMADARARLSDLEEQYRSLSTLKEVVGATNQPMKPNNWDSVRQAFKGPARIEINERD
jgi:hypothetical protein